MFHTKICGVRSEADVLAVADSSADAIGLNFYSNSIRYADPTHVETSRLSQLAKTHGLTRVGVFVNETAGSIAAIADQVGIDVIQIHGDEAVDIVTSLQGVANLPIIRAIKLPTGPISIEQVDQAARAWMDLGVHVLLDADAGAAHGGSGKTLNWESIFRWAMTLESQESWTLAGGLNPANVQRAIRQSGAVSVDTASGAESPRGTKSAERIKEFAKNAAAGFAS